jgi:hypothetical protein
VTGCTLLIAGVLIEPFENILAGSDLSRFGCQPATPEAVEGFLPVFDPVPPGTLGDGYMRMVSNTEIQQK